MGPTVLGQGEEGAAGSARMLWTPAAAETVRFSLFPHVQPIVFKEKLTMKTDSLMEEKLECCLWCCLSDPSIPGRCCVLERRIVPWMQQESYSSCSPIWSVDSDEPNLTSVLERLEDTKDNSSFFSSETRIGSPCSSNLQTAYCGTL
ncbi:putative ubiquitin-conjugating enzyme E2Q2-like protein [Pan troglodytes]|uniref:putative ubiquitin-conjugating enzyme E2Q2-like protein n=1 Tax=Pan troglodytes TaxID=9598 RepID=UPI0023EF5738|nr:putative ubiquitin-conjugating enzyme E2Q2-like protein [Pan troglodytes]